MAPPDHHIVIRPGRVHSTRGPKENGHRPAVDPLFRSAALAYGPRVVAVVLSGSLDDGTAGLAAVKERGGVTVVQSPEEALYPSMPRSAMLTVEVDHVLPVAGIAELIVSLAGDPRPTPEIHLMDDRPAARKRGPFRRARPRGDPRRRSTRAPPPGSAAPTAAARSGS